jgi:hypothetical protein
MHIVLLIIYGILLSLAVVRIPFVKKSAIRPAYLLVFFWLRCMASWVHNAIAYRYYPNHGDIWDYFETGKWMKGELLQGHLLQRAYHGSQQLQLNDVIRGELSFRTLSTLNMVLDFFSFNNFYINSLLFSFVAFMGCIALYRVFQQSFPNAATNALVVLLLPSTLFFSACIHKEGLLLTLLGFALWYWQQQLKNGFTLAGIVTCALLFAAMVLLRTNLLIGLLPGLLAWTIAQKTAIRTRLNLLVSTAVTIGFFVVAAWVKPAYNILAIIVNRQQEFHSLQGNSRLYLPVLQPGGAGFISALPYAFVNGFAAPLPGRAGQPVYLFFSLELMAIWGLLLAAIYYRWRHQQATALPAFGWFCLLLAVPQLLLIGYIVPFAGAIVRYRSLYLPFLLIPILLYLQHTKWLTTIEKWLRRNLLRSD